MSVVRVPDSRVPRALVEIETLHKPTAYPPLQLARVCHTASVLKAHIGTARLIYLGAPDDRW